MATMWTPAPQRDVVRQQQYRRWVLTTEPSKKTPMPTARLGPLDWELAVRDAWDMARKATDTWAPYLATWVTARPSSTGP